MSEWIRKLSEAYAEVNEKKKMDPVDPNALKGSHSDRKDKDIDNDGDVDKSDEYLHNRRKTVKKAMAKEGDVEMNPKKKDSKKVMADTMEEVDLEKYTNIKFKTANIYAISIIFISFIFNLLFPEVSDNRSQIDNFSTETTIINEQNTNTTKVKKSEPFEKNTLNSLRFLKVFLMKLRSNSLIFFSKQKI